MFPLLATISPMRRIAVFSEIPLRVELVTPANVEEIVETSQWATASTAAARPGVRTVMVALECCSLSLLPSACLFCVDRKNGDACRAASPNRRAAGRASRGTADCRDYPLGLLPLTD